MSRRHGVFIGSAAISYLALALMARSVQYGIDQRLLPSLTGWEFRTATKDDVGVMAEFLLSIPAKGL